MSGKLNTTSGVLPVNPICCKDKNGIQSKDSTKSSCSTEPDLGELELLKQIGSKLEKLADEKSRRSDELWFAKSIVRLAQDLQEVLSKHQESTLNVSPLFSKTGLSTAEAGMPGQITPLDHQIYLQGKMTSTYEERQQAVETHKSQDRSSGTDREKELGDKLKIYQAELRYHQRISAAEASFQQDVQMLFQQLQGILDTREQIRRKAASKLLKRLGLKIVRDVEQLPF